MAMSLYVILKDRRVTSAILGALTVLTLQLLLCAAAVAGQFQIDGRSPNLWPGVVAFRAPCGVQSTAPTDPADWVPSNSIMSMDQNNPSALCANTVDTLTDPSTLKPTSVGAVNSKYTGLPDGSPLPPTTSIVGGGVNAPQDPQNAPTPIVEVSPSGSMEFMVPWQFMDESDTKFEGKIDAAIETPYDDRKCPNLATAIDAATGLPKASSIPLLCQIIKPSDYLDALKQGHVIKWAEYSSASVTAYGPADTTIPSTAMPFQIQAKGGYTQGMLAVPYETENNSTIVRLAVRYGVGFDGVMPLTWGGWPEPYCARSTCLRPTYWAGAQTAWLYSQPVTVQIVPAALVQFRFLPSLILYQPPGNSSISQISTTDTYTQNYQIDQTSSITDQIEYAQKAKQDDSISPGVTYMGFGGNYNIYTTSGEWDSSAKSATAENYALRVSDAVTLGKSWAASSPKLANSTPDLSRLKFQTEPFWMDQIVVAMHPQFAVWDYPSGTKMQPLGASALHTFYVQELANCLPAFLETADAAGLNVTIDVLNPDNSTGHETERLSWVDCAELLALDPFYKALSQAAVPSMGIPVSAGTISLTTGVNVFKSTAMTAFTTTSSVTNTIKATITATQQSTLNGPSFSGKTWFYNLSVSASRTGSSTSSDEVAVALGTTQSAQTQETFTSEIDLADCPLVGSTYNCGVAPNTTPNVQVFQDTRFGTMMAVLPDLAIKPPQSSGPASRAPKYLSKTGLTVAHLAIRHDTRMLSASADAKKMTFHFVPNPLPAPAPPAPPIQSPPGRVVAMPADWQGKIFAVVAPRP